MVVGKPWPAPVPAWYGLTRSPMEPPLALTYAARASNVEPRGSHPDEALQVVQTEATVCDTLLAVL